MRVDGPLARRLWPPDGGGLCRRVVKEKVLRIDRPDGRRVLKFDGPSGRGLRIALRAMLMKSALRDLLSVSYDKIIILLNYLPSADTPPIRLCRTSPASGGRINRSMLSCRDMAPWLSIHSPTAPRGKGGAVRHQRGDLPRPQGGCMVFAAKGGIKNDARKGAVPRQRSDTIYLPRAGALNPPVRRSRSQAEPWQPRAERPGGWLNPHARKGVSTYGNTGKHRPDPDPGPDRAISPIKKAALRQQVDGN